MTEKRKDIVEILRAGHQYTGITHDYEREAADEIERLRRTNAKLCAAFRVNMLRLTPSTTHEEIDRVLEACNDD